MLTPEDKLGAVRDRLSQIEAVTDSALAHLKTEDLLDELLERLRQILHVDTAAVLLLHVEDRELVATAAKGLEEEVRQGVRIPLGRGFSGRIAESKGAVVIDRVDHTTVLNPMLEEKGITSLLGVPLLVEGRVLGVLHVGTVTGRRFTAADAELLQMAADRVALALHSRLAEEERAGAVALQRSLLPRRLPDILGLQTAARYVSGEEEGEIGGDWYDLFTLPSGRVCVTIGDVVGRGLRAAIVMGRLRNAVRACALETTDPAEVLDRVDRVMQHFEPAEMATVLYGVLDPTFERLHMSSAGHLPPVLAAEGRPATLVDIPPDVPLGALPAARRRTTTIDVPPGALLCLYTDGLVERRGESLDVGLERLRDAVTPGPTDDVCMAVMAKLVGDLRPVDDIALIALRRLELATAPFHMETEAVPAALADIRAGMRRWFDASGVGSRDATDLLLATGEATSNVVEHAYGPKGGTIGVHMELVPPEVIVTVHDTGTWRSPRGDDRGRGRGLMEMASDGVAIQRRPAGTEVIIRRRLREEVR